MASVAVIGSAGRAGGGASCIDGFVSAASRRELKPVVEQLFADPALVSRQLLDDLLKYKRLDGVRRGAHALARRSSPARRQARAPVPRLEGSGLPLVVLWGREDRIIPAAHADHAPPGSLGGRHRRRRPHGDDGEGERVNTC